MSRRLAFFTTSGVAALVLAACGTVTGLSDDYTYDLDAASSSADGSGGDGAATDGAADASGGDAGRCSEQQINAVKSQFDSHGGDKLTPACDACILGGCCTQIGQCLGNSTCSNVLDCVLQCQDNVQGRQACVDNCKSGNVTGPGLVATLTSCAPSCSQGSSPLCRLR